MWWVCNFSSSLLSCRKGEGAEYQHTTMFYSFQIIGKKGPLAKVWLAAHWDKKLSKQQVAATDIRESVGTFWVRTGVVVTVADGRAHRWETSRVEREGMRAAGRGGVQQMTVVVVCYGNSANCSAADADGAAHVGSPVARCGSHLLPQGEVPARRLPGCGDQSQAGACACARGWGSGWDQGWSRVDTGMVLWDPVPEGWAAAGN